MRFELRKYFCLGSLGTSHLKLGLLGLFRFVWDEDSIRCYWVSRGFAVKNLECPGIFILGGWLMRVVSVSGLRRNRWLRCSLVAFLS
jgi:hypothetical protein